MKLKLNLGLFIIAIMALFIIVISVILLQQTFKASADLGTRSTHFKTYEHVEYTRNTNNNEIINTYYATPVSAGHSDMNRVLVGIKESVFLTEVREVSKFPAILLVIAIVAATTILLIVFSRARRSIIAGTGTLDCIPEEEWDTAMIIN